MSRLLSRLTSALRLYNGSKVAWRNAEKVPSHSLTLYEYEQSPWCRKVREALCILDLNVEIKPCPRETFRTEGAFSETSINRRELSDRYGKERLLFPCLVDGSTGTVMNESSEIIDYLWDKYGKDIDQTANRPKTDLFFHKLPSIFELPLLMSLRPLPANGLMATETKFRSHKHQNLELYTSECSTHGRYVREALCTLQLPYEYRTMASGTLKKLPDRAVKVLGKESLGEVEFFLYDPNADGMFGGNESEKALQYLFDKYQAGPTLSVTNAVQRNHGRDGSLAAQLLKNIF